MSIKYERDIEKLLDTVIDIAATGVPIQAIIRSLIKNTAENRLEIEDIKKEFLGFRKAVDEYLSEQEDEDDGE